MNKVFRFIKSITYSLQAKIVSSRAITAFILLLLCNILFAMPILKFTNDIGYKCNVTMLPFFLAALGYMCLFIPIVIYYYSGVPYLNNVQLYCIIRDGKTKWVLKQIIIIIVMAFIFMCFSIFTSIIPFMIQGDFSNEWNEVAMTLSVTDKAFEYKTVAIAYQILENYTPYSALIGVYFITSLIISFIGVFMFTMSILFSRIIAMCASFIFEILIITTYNSRVLNNYFAYISPFSWTDLSFFNKHYDGKFFYTGTPTIEWCIGFLVIAIFILTVISMIRIKYMTFTFINED